MRGATTPFRETHVQVEISIHAPHAGRDVLRRHGIVAGKLISIHAPHAGRDLKNVYQHTMNDISIHAPHAGRDYATQGARRTALISIHAPHAGRDWLLLPFPAPYCAISIHAPHAGRDMTK